MAGKFCTTLHTIVKFLIPTWLIANLKSDQLIFNDHLCAIIKMVKKGMLREVSERRYQLTPKALMTLQKKVPDDS